MIDDRGHSCEGDKNCALVVDMDSEESIQLFGRCCIDVAERMMNPCDRRKGEPGVYAGLVRHIKTTDVDGYSATVLNSKIGESLYYRGFEVEQIGRALLQALYLSFLECPMCVHQLHVDLQEYDGDHE